jgi:ABC-type sugar transport system substrate-binding protein
MKKITVFVLVLLTIAGIVFAGPGGQKGGKLKIGISVMTMNNPFFLAEIEGFQTAADKIWGKGNYDLVTPDPALDITKQIEQCQDLVNQKVAALLIDAIDQDAIQPAVEAAVKAKIPVISIDGDIPKMKSQLLTAIYSDNVNAGRIAAQHLIDAIGGSSGDIGILNHPEVQSVRDRTSGLQEILKKYPGIRVVADIATHGNVTESQQGMETFLQSQPNMKGVFAINDPTAQGAIAAIKSAKKDIKVVAIDGSQNAIDMIKAGELVCSAAQDPRAIGAKAAEVLKMHIDGKKVDATYIIDTFPINQQNWRQYDGKQF